MIRRILLLIVVVGLVLLLLIAPPLLAAHFYGPPSSRLTGLQVLQYSARVLWDDGLITEPIDPLAPEVDFAVHQGESVSSVCVRLESLGLVRDASSLRDYLIYSGLDTSIQAGKYKVSAGMSVVDIAHRIQDATPEDVTFVVLPGWRLEEIALALPSSGLGVEPEEFLRQASSPRADFDFLNGATTVEGFLYPDTYILPRATGAEGLIGTLIRNFSLHLGADMEEDYARQKLSVYQAVTLASIIQREAVRPEEGPQIASVYLNRLKSGMRLDADPTVQYALGFNAAKATWWTNPLSLEDLKVASPYNTYLNGGLPPAPIDNPGSSALDAVATPADSPYYYFTARCDASGYHVFARTFEEHLRNLCP